MGFYDDLARLLTVGRPLVVATVIEASGSTPQKPGSKMWVLEDGTLGGTIGGGAIEHQVVEAGLALLRSPEQTRVLETHLTHDLGMCCGGKMKVFLEKHSAAPRLLIYGAGHVAAEVASRAHEVGFQVTVVDDRSQWLTASRFPGAQTLSAKDPAEHAQSEPGGEDCFVAVMTHDHALDQRVVEALLKKPLAYLGVIGSRRKAERFRMRLAAAGHSPAELERLRSPMGVAIHALTPQEIAISIVAELIALRRSHETRKKRPPASTV